MQAAAENGLAEAATRGAAVAREARDAWGELDNAIREAVRERPDTALAIAAAAGFPLRAGTGPLAGHTRLRLTFETGFPFHFLCTLTFVIGAAARNST
jgi:hypothetical protein